MKRPKTILPLLERFKDLKGDITAHLSKIGTPEQQLRSCVQSRAARADNFSCVSRCPRTVALRTQLAWPAGSTAWTQCYSRQRVQTLKRGSLTLVVTMLTGCTFEVVRLNPCAPSQTDQACAGPTEVRTEPAIDPGSDQVQRFFAVGDAGLSLADDPSKLAPSTVAVQRLVLRVCRSRGGCDFGVFLGDNVYESGVVGEPQSAFLETFSATYSEGWQIPLIYVLGNHDYSPYVASTQRARQELSTLQTLSDRHHGLIRGRAHFFDFQATPLHLFAWDTNYLVRVCDQQLGAQPECVAEGDQALRSLAASKSRFKIWLGHHPFWSNGEHGDAGEFEECLGPLCFPPWPGDGLRQLAKEHVIGHADLMLSGHDHNLQAFSAPELNGTALVVSGAGAKKNPLGRDERRREAWFERGFTLGFALVEASSKRLRVSLFALESDRSESGGGSEKPAFVMCKTLGSDWQRGAEFCPDL